MKMKTALVMGLLCTGAFLFSSPLSSQTVRPGPAGASPNGSARPAGSKPSMGDIYRVDPSGKLIPSWNAEGDDGCLLHQGIKELGGTMICCPDAIYNRLRQMMECADGTRPKPLQGYLEKKNLNANDMDFFEGRESLSEFLQDEDCKPYVCEDQDCKDDKSGKGERAKKPRADPRLMEGDDDEGIPDPDTDPRGYHEYMEELRDRHERTEGREAREQREARVRQAGDNAVNRDPAVGAARAAEKAANEAAAKARDRERDAAKKFEEAKKNYAKDPNGNQKKIDEWGKAKLALEAAEKKAADEKKNREAQEERARKAAEETQKAKEEAKKKEDEKGMPSPDGIDWKAYKKWRADFCRDNPNACPSRKDMAIRPADDSGGRPAPASEDEGSAELGCIPADPKLARPGQDQECPAMACPPASKLSLGKNKCPESNQRNSGRPSGVSCNPYNGPAGAIDPKE